MAEVQSLLHKYSDGNIVAILVGKYRGKLAKIVGLDIGSRLVTLEVLGKDLQQVLDIRNIRPYWVQPSDEFVIMPNGTFCVIDEVNVFGPNITLSGRKQDEVAVTVRLRSASWHADLASKWFVNLEVWKE